MILAINGGRDPGAVGPTGVAEAIIALAVSKKLAAILSPVAEVKLTRTDDIALGPDVNSDLANRAKIANNWGTDCFISIHCNSVANPEAHGTETYHYPCSIKGLALASAVHKQLIPALGRTDRGVKQKNLAVLRLTNCPAVLVELAFISNPTEEGLLESDSFQQKAAQAIAQGVADYLGLQLPALSVTPKIVVGGKVLDGIIIDDHTYAPVRAVAEALGKTVQWDEATKTATII